jgi:hypothetical protein
METFAARDRQHGAERLERLKQFVLDPKLNPHARFDFADVVAFDEDVLTDDSPGERLNQVGWKCGTVGCLIGTAPAAFPEHWKFTDWDVEAVGCTDGSDGWASFFGLTQREEFAAFLPEEQNLADLPFLDRDCTAEQACANLDILISRMKGGAV